MTQVTPLLPDTSNPVLAPHWEAAAAHRLEIPYCAQCGAPQWPPRPNCLRCHTFEFEWREVEPRGRLYSFIVAHKPLHPSVESEVPYLTGIVELTAGVKCWVVWSAPNRRTSRSGCRSRPASSSGRRA